jgi:hypothetical protein
MRSSLEADVLMRCDQLREEFPTIARSVERPKGWTDLYAFFDAHDLYTEGPLFCFQVVGRLAQDNEKRSQEFLEIKNNAKDWMLSNRDRILNSHINADMFPMFTADRRHSTKSMTADETRRKYRLYFLSPLIWHHIWLVSFKVSAN